jgi:hypothetical protein
VAVDRIPADGHVAAADRPPAGVDRHSEIARATNEVGADSIRTLALTGGELRGRVIVESGRLEDAGSIRLFIRPSDAREAWPPYVRVFASEDGRFDPRNVSGAARWLPISRGTVRGSWRGHRRREGHQPRGYRPDVPGAN